MALTEKQAMILGGGGLVVLFLLRSKTAHAKPLVRAAGGGPHAKLATSNKNPSTNLATRNATLTTAQNPSTIGFRAGAAQINVPTSAIDKLFSLFRGSPVSASASKPAGSAAPSSGGGSGGTSTQAAKSGYQAPGGNPWSSSGDFTGRTSVAGGSPDSGGNLQGYDTGLSSTSGAGGDVGLAAGQSPQNTDLLAAAREGMDASGTVDGDPAAIQYDFVGPVLPADAPAADTSGGYYDEASGQFIDSSAAAAPTTEAWAGPVDTSTAAPLDSYATTPIADMTAETGASFVGDSDPSEE